MRGRRLLRHGMLKSRWMILLGGMVVLVGCAMVAADTTSLRSTGRAEYGEAAYYAAKYQSRPTASGELLEQSALTAAHRTLAFGTKVRVTNLANNKSVIVRINDRGPYTKGRVIDLTRHAFSTIADPAIGIIKVKIEVLDR